MSLPRFLAIFFGLACSLAASPTTPIDPARTATSLAPTAETVVRHAANPGLSQKRWGQSPARRVTKFQASLQQARAASAARAQAYQRAVKMETCNQFVPSASAPAKAVRAGSGAPR